MSKKRDKKSERRQRKSTLGQSEILIALLFMILVSGAVIAQNATNMTNLTGDFIDIADFENITNQTRELTKTIEASKIIHVYAGSELSLHANNTRPYQNETIVLNAYLTLDNGSVLSDKWILFYLDKILMGSSITNTRGHSSLVIDLSDEIPGKRNISAEFSGEGLINPSYDEIGIEILPIGNKTAGGIIYDPVTDTIMLVSDGLVCSAISPCGPAEIYEADQLGGWEQVQKISDSYYVFDAALVIGDGITDTWFAYEWGEVWINKPWIILSNSHVRFGHNELPFGCFIDSNVAEGDLLEKGSSIYVQNGAYFEVYNSNFKVFHETAANNIYFEPGSQLESVRFSMQNVHDDERIPTLYAPSERRIEKMSVAKNNCIDSLGNSICSDLIEKEGRFETVEEIQ